MSDQNWIYLSPPHLDGTEKEHINETLETNWVSTEGTAITQFEERLEKYLGEDVRAVALNSGTSALHLGLRLLDVKEGDSVITPTFSFCASANPIIYQGADPTFIDCESETWGIDPNLLEEAISKEIKNGRKPKAIMMVHTYGTAAKVAQVKAISDHYEIPIIEDAAEAMGSKFGQRMAGTLGDLSVFSFNGNKILTTGSGGALIVRSDELYEKIVKWSLQSKEKRPFYHHEELGYNYRMTNMAAALGLGQFEHLSERVDRRKEIFQEYRKYLTLEGMSFPDEVQDTDPNRWLTTLLVDPEITGLTNVELRTALSQLFIESRLVWQPLHMQPLYDKYPSYISGVAEELFSKGLCLPSGSQMSSEQIHSVVSAVQKILSRKKV